MKKAIFSFLFLFTATHAAASAPPAAVEEIDRLFGVLNESVLSRLDHNNFEDTQFQYRQRVAELRRRGEVLCRQARSEECLPALRFDERLGSSDCFLKRWEGRAEPGHDRRGRAFSLSFTDHALQWVRQQGNCNRLLAQDTRHFGRVRAPRPADQATGAPNPNPNPNPSPNPASGAAVGLRNIRPDTCKWVGDLPRRIINAPGCTTGTRNRICVGFVSCERSEGSGKFVRLSTCRAEYCGASDQDAVRCTQDMNFSSSRPSDEIRDTVSPQLNERLSSGGSRQ
jgi:hypothetical protein